MSHGQEKWNLRNFMSPTIVVFISTIVLTSGMYLSTVKATVETVKNNTTKLDTQDKEITELKTQRTEIYARLGKLEFKVDKLTEAQSEGLNRILLAFHDMKIRMDKVIEK